MMWRDPSLKNQTFQVRHVMSDGWGEPVQINRRPHSKMAFSDYEKEQLRESIGFLTLAFALALSNGLFVVIDEPSILITTLPLAFAAVMTGFLLHELAHKWLLGRIQRQQEWIVLCSGHVCIRFSFSGTWCSNGVWKDNGPTEWYYRRCGALNKYRYCHCSLTNLYFHCWSRLADILAWGISKIHNCNKSYTRRIQHDTRTTSGWIQGHNVEQTSISGHNCSNLCTGDGLLE